VPPFDLTILARCNPIFSKKNMAAAAAARKKLAQKSHARSQQQQREQQQKEREQLSRSLTHEAGSHSRKKSLDRRWVRASRARVRALAS
jgi:hypothetical protein